MLGLGACDSGFDRQTLGGLQNKSDPGTANVSDVAEVVDDVEAAETSRSELPVIDQPDIGDGMGCLPGSKSCQGLQLATCTSAGDGWFASPCPPNSACKGGACVELGRNLVIL
ncbi:MAG: hypothetical protein ACI9WU_002729, partial [Myxococcota bacterium]